MGKYEERAGKTLKVIGDDDNIYDLLDKTSGAQKVKVVDGDITISTGDIEIGAVEIKDATTDNRMVVDENGNAQVTLGTALDKDNDSVKSYPANGTYVNLTASGQILAGPGKILGFYVNSTDAGTLRISDALTATTPYLGAAATPAIGWHQYPANLATGGYVTIAGTALDVTFFVIPD